MAVARSETADSASNPETFRPQEYSLLVIDDDPDQLINLQEILKGMGFHVHVRSSPKEGLSLLSRLYFDLLICDLNMPAITGYELIDSVRKVRTIPAGAKLPIIVLSGSIPSSPDAIKKIGADAYCDKREGKWELTRKIQQLLVQQ